MEQKLELDRLYSPTVLFMQKVYKNISSQLCKRVEKS